MQNLQKQLEAAIAKDTKRNRILQMGREWMKPMEKEERNLEA
jgi:hypothetical protein